MSWTDIASVWLDELAGDEAYESVVTPLLLEVLRPSAGDLYVDLGCGEGRIMRALTGAGARVIGVEANQELAKLAGDRTIVAELPVIPMRSESVDGVYTVLVLEHISDHRWFFAETARVTKSGGALGLVMNHPYWTAPGSTPVTDRDDEVLWRPGEYFPEGSSEVLLSGHPVIFHHRSMAALLSSAADAGWALISAIERPHHDRAQQPGIPRLLACRWELA